MTEKSQFVQFFRQAAPYIHKHRDKTFVFCIQDNVTSKKQLQSVLHDIAILHSLRAKIVIVFGARQSINNEIKNSEIINNKRITDKDTIQQIQSIVGTLKIRIESILSMGLINSPMQGASIQTCSGNFVIAKPIGIIDGVDFKLTGEVRKIKKKAINNKLEQNDIVIIPPIGYSNTGEVFNLTTEEIASKVAIELKADKLLFINDDIDTIFPDSKNKAITPQSARLTATKDDVLTNLLNHAADACENGVSRIHLIQKNIDGAIIAELFTRDGFGVMITNEAYDRIEQATANDIPSLLALIRPMEEKGILVKRSRELIEIEINHFMLLKIDNTIIGCAALYPYKTENVAELACLVISEEYQKSGKAELLLNKVIEEAKKQHIEKLFCLTTHTSHWFVEHGFIEAKIDELPIKKQELYNYKRGSKPLIKKI